jgi:hypothetical protein
VRETFAEMDRLWRQTASTLAVSLYRGEDDRCISYSHDDVCEFASGRCDRWILDASYLPNDMLIVMYRR